MKFWNIIVTGLQETWANRFRSLLTMLGIILGVSSLVGMSAMVKGMENGLKEALVEAGGLEKLEIQAEDDLPIYQRHLEDQAPGIRLGDVYALRAGAPLLSNTSPSVEIYGRNSSIRLSRGGRRCRPDKVVGAWNGVLDLEEHSLEHGRYFHSIDEEEARSVCIIGTQIRDDLFPPAKPGGAPIIPIGETIQVAGQPFIIIGMFKRYESERSRKERLAIEKQRAANGGTAGPRRSGGRRGSSDDWVYRMKNDSIYMPLTTMLRKFRSGTNEDGSDDPRLSHITTRISDIEKLEPAIQQARNVLLMRHGGIEDFRFRTEEDQQEEMNLAITNYRSSGGLISAICMVVGGIGIMNIMLASISQRVREIGIRKSVGATDSELFSQILVESLLIALVGGTMGLLVSVGLVFGIDFFTPTGNDPEITSQSMGFAFACSALVGILAGLIPAFKAARLHPIQALKYD